MSKCSYTSAFALAAAVLAATAFNASAKNVDFTKGVSSVYDCYHADYCYDGTKQNDGYTRNGFNYEVDNWHNELPGDNEGLTLDDDGGASSFVFREDGRRFSVRSVDLNSGNVFNSIYKSGFGPAPSHVDGDLYDPDTPYYAWSRAGTYEKVIYGIYGYRGLSKVSDFEFDSSIAGGELRLPAGFKNLDALRIVLLFKLSDYDNGYRDPGDEPNLIWCQYDTCSHIELTKMQVKVLSPSPVPLPAALPLLIAGLGGLGLIGRRKKKAA